MNVNHPVLRDAVGFLVGGLIAAVGSGLVSLAFFPLPPPKPTDHTREAMTMLVLVTFVCGGFIGRRGFSADFLSQLLPSVIGSYVVMVFLCVLASLDFTETATMIGLASAGVLPSATVVVLLGRRFPPDTDTDDL